MVKEVDSKSTGLARAGSNPADDVFLFRCCAVMVVRCFFVGKSLAVPLEFLRNVVIMDSMFGPSESSNIPAAFKAKVILLGDHAVGKSAIVTRYIKNYFE